LNFLPNLRLSIDECCLNVECNTSAILYAIVEVL
jgi:hypothetical protein